MGLIVKLRPENMTPENHIKRPSRTQNWIFSELVGPWPRRAAQRQPQPIEGEIDIITLVNPCSCSCLFVTHVRFLFLWFP
jgi:hypothetical protein